MIRQLFCWYHARTQAAGVVATDGTQWWQADPIAYIDGLTQLGVTEAFQVKENRQGYVQELRIPWTAIVKSGRPYKAGESFACMVDLVWGPDSGKGWPVNHCMDLVRPGAEHTQWFWEVGEIHGSVKLSPEGHLKAPTTAAARKPRPVLAGTIAVNAAIPAKATRFTLAINDAEGHRMRNLGGDLSPDDYAITEAPAPAGMRTVRVMWDGLDDAGKLVPPGRYNVVGLAHEGLHAAFEMAYYNPGTPPWPTADGRGAWGSIGEELVGLGLLLFVGTGEGEAFVLVTEDAVALEAVDADVNGGGGGVVFVVAAAHFGGEPGHGFVDAAVFDHVQRVGEEGLEAREDGGERRVGGGAVEDVEGGGGGGLLGGEGEDGSDHHREGGLFLLADEEDVDAALTAEGDGGGVFDGDGFAEEGDGCGGGGWPGGLVEEGGEALVAGDVGGGIAFEDDGGFAAVGGQGGGARQDAVEVFVTLAVGEPGDLEGAVGFDEAAGVVVDGFAGTGEE